MPRRGTRNGSQADEQTFSERHRQGAELVLEPAGHEEAPRKMTIAMVQAIDEPVRFQPRLFSRHVTKALQAQSR